MHYGLPAEEPCRRSASQQKVCRRLPAINGAVFTDAINHRFLLRNPLPTIDFQVIDCAASGFGL
jgi:hypothetical protein